MKYIQISEIIYFKGTRYDGSTIFRNEFYMQTQTATTKVNNIFNDE